MPLVDVDELKRNPIRFTIPLAFPEEDKLAYPWLSQRDRYYKIEQQMGTGGFSLAFRGMPCDADGTVFSNADPVVIKVPNLSLTHPLRDMAARLGYIQAQSIAEWEVIRKKLSTCRHANPIFDLGSIWASGPPLTQLFVTAQRFLFDAVPLQQWLVNRGLRATITFDAQGQEVCWHGIADWNKWLRVATMLAEGLAQIHTRRVIHGDVWPSNIYIKDGDDPYAIFIDFGESFLVLPTGEPRIQPNHAYRAPERETAESVKTEQVDVYSFGKLLLYLSIGEDRVIPRLSLNRLLYGHNRRNWIREALFQGNPGLVTWHPEVVDLISQCVEVDPVARPTMLEMFDQLHELSSNRLPVSSRHDAAVQRIRNLTTSAHYDSTSPVFTRLIDRKIIEVQRLIDSCHTEMVELSGTRDVLIGALTTIFGELSVGDSWTALTTPAVWQHDALGLDGRYATATIQAIRRDASVQRTFAFSVEELGVEWVGKLVNLLKASPEIRLLDLAVRLDKAIADCVHHKTNEDYCPKSPEYLKYHQQRLAFVVESIHIITQRWDLERLVFKDAYQHIHTTNGLFVGLTPVGTELEIRQHRAQNPASLMYSSMEADYNNRWLMVMTDMRGRNENEPLDRTPGTILGTSNAPQLRRVRVYRSVMGVPTDRILALETLMRTHTFNLGPVVSELYRCIRAI